MNCISNVKVHLKTRSGNVNISTINLFIVLFKYNTLVTELDIENSIPDS